MSNTKEGGKAVIKTMSKKFGSHEAYREYMRSIAAKGGKNGRTGGFHANRLLAAQAGKLGGSISKRRPKKTDDNAL